jgi:tRNA threonylcarbamoyladenosine biosynthesis protein TsaB
MQTLAIETVETRGSVAALNDATVLNERALEPARRSAQTLAPAIADLLAEMKWTPNDVELVAVATGPGSFTGLRIGVTTAKTFAYAVGCQTIGVHTLLAIAARVPGDVPRFSVVLDAQRAELFVADFSRQADGQLTGHEATRIVRAQDWLASLSAGAVVTGPGLTSIGQMLPTRVTVIDPASTAPTAATIGQVAWRLFSSGQRGNVFDLIPQYFHRPAAEEQWERKRKPL